MNAARAGDMAGGAMPAVPACGTSPGIWSWALSVQFLLGMAVNRLGRPSQATGAARAARTVFLVAHVVIALGMAAGAVMVIRAGAGPRSRWRLETWGAAAIAVTIAAGILTMVTKSNWWSYVLALGFIASLLTYGGLLVRVRPSRPPAG